PVVSRVSPFTIRRPPTRTPFPYTTLFRSAPAAGDTKENSHGHHLPDPDEPLPHHCPGRWSRRGCRPDRLQFRRCRDVGRQGLAEDRKSTRLNSSHVKISYAVFCLKKKKRK